jgi:hypothetical protein
LCSATNPAYHKLATAWFVGLNTDDPVWVPTVFTHKRDRLLEGEIVTKLFGQVLAQAEEKGLTSDEGKEEAVRERTMSRGDQYLTLNVGLSSGLVFLRS